MWAFWHSIIVVVGCKGEVDWRLIRFIWATHNLIVLAIFVAFGIVGCEFYFHELICAQRELMLKLVPTGDWSDNAVDSKRDCLDRNLCKVRLHGAFGLCEQKVKPIDVDVQTIGVNAIFGYVTE